MSKYQLRKKTTKGTRMIFNIFAKYTLNGNEYEEILSTAFKMTPAMIKSLGGKAKALEKLKQEKKHDFLLKAFEKDNTMGETLISIDIVSSTMGPWVDGEYYAHEYDAHTPGRARIIKYSNKFIECEVQCLDKSKHVADGIWSIDYPDSIRLKNGCGDHFTPVRKLT